MLEIDYSSLQFVSSHGQFQEINFVEFLFSNLGRPKTPSRVIILQLDVTTPGELLFNY